LRSIAGMMSMAVVGARRREGGGRAVLML